MPLYEYICEEGHIKKEVRSIHDDEPEIVSCVECFKTMRQVVGGVGIKFKGSGFYSTDKGKRG